MSPEAIFGIILLALLIGFGVGYEVGSYLERNLIMKRIENARQTRSRGRAP